MTKPIVGLAFADRGAQVYPPTVTRTVLGTALIAMTLAFAAGCGGSNPSPSPSPTPQPSPTATATGKVAPPLPPAATAHTKAGAIAFVRHYVAMFNYAQSTGDTRSLRRLGLRDCISCTDVADAIDKVYRAGGSARGGELAISRAEAVRSANKLIEVDIAGNFSASTVVASSGATPEHRKGDKTVASFYVRFHNSAWKVARWSRVS